MKKFLIVITVLIGGFFVYNFDVVLGQWRFDRLCKAEGGSRIYTKVERDVGWYVEHFRELAYQAPFNFGHVKFVRYRDKHGDLFDVHPAPGPTQWSKGYRMEPVNSAASARYLLDIQQSRLPNERNISRTLISITDLKSGQLVATHTSFDYEWIGSDRMPLSLPTSQYCNGGTDFNSFANSLFIQRAVNE
jgi:hypothetical protein